MDTKEQIEDIRLDELDYSETRTRAALSEVAVNEYAEMLRAGIKLDPPVVFRTADGRLHPSSGEHRKEAHKAAGKDVMRCVVREGTKWNAIYTGILDNQKHGVRITAADKRHIVCTVLRERSDYSDNKIAHLCGVDGKTVGKYRSELEATKEIPQTEERVGRDDRTRRVGRQDAEPAAQPSVTPPAASTGCPGCGGEWINDGEGERFCPDCNTVHPDNPRSDPDASSPAFSLPKFGMDQVAYTANANDDFAEVVAQHNGRLRVIVYQMGRVKERAKERDVPVSPNNTDAVTWALKDMGFIQEAPWELDRLRPEYDDPNYEPPPHVPTPMYQQWAEDHAVLEFLFQKRELPKRGNLKFWGEVDKLLGKVRRGNGNEFTYDNYVEFCDKWDAKFPVNVAA
jgi:hypothetical protein